MGTNALFGHSDSSFNLNSDDFDGGIEDIVIRVFNIIDSDGDETDDEFYVDVPVGVYLDGDSSIRNFAQQYIEDIVDYMIADFEYDNDEADGVLLIDDDFFSK